MSKQVAFIAITLMLTAGCGGSGLGSRPPTLPSSVPSPPSASVPSPDGFRLSGTVLETVPQGPRPAPGGQVFFWIESRFGGRVPVDPNGRYVIAGLAPAPIVRLTWIPSPELLELYQPCLTTVVMPAADTERNIEVVQLGSANFSYESPTLSGLVYETTVDGRRPLPHTRVLYSIDNSSGFDAYADTDAEGRYTFCRVLRGSGRLGAGDCNDAVFWFPVEVNGDTVLDVDLRPFKEACP